MEKIAIIFILLLLVYSSKGLSLSGVVIPGDHNTFKQNAQWGIPLLWFYTPLKVLNYKNYIVGYSPYYKIPLWVQYSSKGKILYCQMTPREEIKFVSDPTLPRRESSFHEDYYDPNCYKNYTNPLYARCHRRGHLASYFYFVCNRDNGLSTFVTTNIVPQVQMDFNDGIWSHLERVEKRCAQKFALTTIVGVIPSQFRLPSGVNIPDYMYKILYNEKTGKLIAFLMKNTNHFGTNLWRYVILLDNLEKLTGFTFLPNIPNTNIKSSTLHQWDCLR
jgi:DNA/RNA endonuclease G (NUC1)